MLSLFLDTNVIIDFLADRKPFSLDAAKLFNYSTQQKVKIYISAVSYNNIYYILRQSVSHNATIQLLSELSELADITDVTKDVIKRSITTGFKDFEDAIQYNCALTIKELNSIVTRDTKDFSKSILPVMTPSEAVTLITNTTG